MPKVSQGVTKVHQKVDLRKRSQKGSTPTLSVAPILEQFSIKIDEQIDAEIDAEKVRKITEKTMRKWTCILMIFGFASHEKSSFSKKAHVREP